MRLPCLFRRASLAYILIYFQGAAPRILVQGNFAFGETSFAFCRAASKPAKSARAHVEKFTRQVTTSNNQRFFNDSFFVRALAANWRNCSLAARYCASAAAATHSKGLTCRPVSFPSNYPGQNSMPTRPGDKAVPDRRERSRGIFHSYPCLCDTWSPPHRRRKSFWWNTGSGTGSLS